MTSKKQKLTDAEIVLKEFLWECGDCGNIYTLNVNYCPNTDIHQFIIKGIVKGVR